MDKKEDIEDKRNKPISSKIKIDSAMHKHKAENIKSSSKVNDENINLKTAEIKLKANNSKIIGTSTISEQKNNESDSTITGNISSKLGRFNTLTKGETSNREDEKFKRQASKVKRQQKNDNLDATLDGIKKLANTTPIKTDSPSTIDLLNRKPFAKYLSLRFGKLWKQINITEEVRTGKSFVTHLYSEWGSGKSTFLNLLKSELHDNPVGSKRKWVIIEFNAWQNQHIEPSWWSLMDSIYLGIVDKASEISFWKRMGLRFKENAWRYFVTKYSVGLPIFLTIFVAVLAFNATGVFVQNAGLITAIAAAVGVAFKTANSLLPGNPKSAKLFQELSSDPMVKIKQHFHKTVASMDMPLIVFIDDLDRCRESYVVSLLESLHTLFNDQRVFYVVAADKKWISSCFHNSYKSIAQHIEEKDRPTGHLFIEKLFQISIGLPSMSKEIRKEFVDKLLDIKEGAHGEFEISQEEDETIISARTFVDFSNLDTRKPEIFTRVMEKSLEDSFDKDVQHILQKYTDYMEPNPRFIKLLINAFGINVAVAMSSGLLLTEEEYEHIAVWTIIALRQPSAAEELASKPTLLNEFPFGKPLEQFPVLSSLIDDNDFKSLLNGHASGTKQGLSKQILRALTGQSPEG